MILEKIKDILAKQLRIDKNIITENTNFKTELKADSIDLLDMMMALEKEYGISFDEEKTEELITVGDVVECVERLKK